MCLIVFNYQPNTATPFVLAANRDEYYARPTLDMQRWKDHPQILAGRDLEQGGTWLGMSDDGRFAAVTNFRQFPLEAAGLSRGQLCSEFLSGRHSAMNFLLGLQAQAQRYSGFNLLVGDSQGLYYYSNRENHLRRLDPGCYGLSNHLLDSPWPKVQWAKASLAESPANHTMLQSLLQNDIRPDDHQLPETGVGLELERLLSTCFIHSESYGTRASTSLIMADNGLTSVVETSYGPYGEKMASHQHSLQVERAW